MKIIKIEETDYSSRLYHIFLSYPLWKFLFEERIVRLRTKFKREGRRIIAGKHCRGKGRGGGVTTCYLESGESVERCDSRLLKISWREKIRSNPSPSSSPSSFLFPTSFWRQARTCLNAAASRRIRRKCELPLFLSRQTIFQGRAASSSDRRDSFGSFSNERRYIVTRTKIFLYSSFIEPSFVLFLLNKHEVNHHPCCHLHLCLW